MHTSTLKITVDAKNGNFLTNAFEDEATLKTSRKKVRRRQVIELDFLSLSPLHRCRTDPFMQFWDPLAGNCYNISCGYHFQNRDGGCFYRNITRPPRQRLCTREILELKWWEVR